MARVLAVDYGTKRCGIAVTDSLQIIASGLTTVSNSELRPFIVDYLSKEKVECIVVGQPIQLNNELSELENDILPFIKFLQKKFPDIKLERIDERFTSKIAFDSILAGGVKKQKRKDKGLIDKVSATLILQSYLEKSAFL